MGRKWSSGKEIFCEGDVIGFGAKAGEVAGRPACQMGSDGLGLRFVYLRGRIGCILKVDTYAERNHGFKMG